MNKGNKHRLMLLCLALILTPSLQSGYLEAVALKYTSCLGLILITPFVINYFRDKFSTAEKLQALTATQEQVTQAVTQLNRNCAQKDDITALQEQHIQLYSQITTVLEKLQALQLDQAQFQQTQALLSEQLVLVQSTLDGLKSTLALNQQENTNNFEDIKTRLQSFNESAQIIQQTFSQLTNWLQGTLENRTATGANPPRLLYKIPLLITEGKRA